MNIDNTKQVFWLSIGNLITFGFSIISVAILSRFLPKNDYGTYRQVIYIYGTLLVVFSAGLPKAYGYFIPRVVSDEIRDIINKISLILSITGFVFSLLLYFGAGIISVALKNPDLEIAIKYFALVPFFTLPTLGIENILAALKKSHITTLYTILSRSFMLLCTAIPVMIFNLGYLEAILGFTISSFISFIIAIYIKKNSIKRFGGKKSKTSYRNILNFSIPLLFANIWGLVISSSDQFFISRYFGNKTFAEFANGFFEFPVVSMIISATATILLPVFSGNIAHNGINDEIKKIWDSSIKKIIILIYPLLVFLIFYAESLMILLYGHQYEQSTYYFQLRTILSFFQIIAVYPVMLALGKVKLYARIHFFIALLLVISEYIIVSFFDSPYLIAYASVVIRILMVIILMKYVSNLLKVSLAELFPIKLQLGFIVLSSISLTIIKILLIKIELNLLIKLFLASIIYVFFVLLIFKLMKINIKPYLQSIIKFKL